MTIELHILDGEGTSRVMPVVGPITLGRSPECDLVVTDPELSWKHCTIWVEHGVPWIRDLKSRNGTFVGEAQIARAVPLAEGAVVKAGSFQATIRGVAGVITARVALALLDEKTGIQHVLRGERFVIDASDTADLRVEGVSATLIVHPGEVWLDDEEVPLDVPRTIGAWSFRIVTVDPVHQPTVEAAGDLYPYSLAVDLNGSTGPVAEIADRSTGKVIVIDATNRAILLYVLAKRWADDRIEGLAVAQRGWVPDDDLIVGVWGKSALADGSGKLKALLHRVRSELRDQGFDPWFIEKKRGFSRVRVADAAV